MINYKVYDVNQKNPSGFDEVLGYDGVGKPHKNPVTGEYLMPHMHDDTVPEYSLSTGALAFLCV